MNIKTIIILSVAIAALTGCNAVSLSQYVVSRYCDLSATARTINRQAVATAIYPNKIIIECNNGANNS